MIYFIEVNNKILFRYTADYTGSVDWINEAIKSKGFIKFKRTYIFQQQHLITNEELFDEDEEDKENYLDPFLEPIVYFNFDCICIGRLFIEHNCNLVRSFFFLQRISYCSTKKY